MPNYKIADDALFGDVISPAGRSLAITSGGTLWATYIKEDGALANEQVFCAYSIDNGVTWTEEEVPPIGDFQNFDSVVAIDSLDVLHLVYCRREPVPFNSIGLFYRQRSVAGVWSAEETISLLNTGGNEPIGSIAIDSVDDVHVAFASKGYAVQVAQWNIKYRKRVAGAWGAVQSVTDMATDQSIVTIAIASDDSVHLAWDGKGWGTHPLLWQPVYSERPGAWANELIVDEDKTDVYPHIAVDSGNNPHVIWRNSTDDQISYSEKAVGWSAPIKVDDSDGVDNSPCSIAVDRLDDIHIAWSGWPWVPPGLNTNIHHRKRESGAWLAVDVITTEPSAQLIPCMLWATFPVIGGVHTNILQARQCFTWESFADSVWFAYIGTLASPNTKMKAYALGRRNV